jgi:hypothetical protein
LLKEADWMIRRRSGVNDAGGRQQNEIEEKRKLNFLV